MGAKVIQPTGLVRLKRDRELKRHLPNSSRPQGKKNAANDLSQSLAAPHVRGQAVWPGRAGQFRSAFRTDLKGDLGCELQVRLR